MKRIESIKKGIKILFFSILPIGISSIALVISIKTYNANQESKPLSYYIKPTVTSFDNNVIEAELEVMVTNGAVGNVRVLDYKDGEVFDVANNVGGVIKETSSKKEHTFEMEIGYDNQQNEFIMTQYLLIDGKDGSKSLGMILYHVNLCLGEVTVDYYSTQDLILAKMNSSQTAYTWALSNYQELVDILKENGEL